MRRVVKLSAALLLIVLLLLNQSVLMCAAESTLTYRGFAQGFDIQPGSGYSETDLFDDFKDVMPGDTLLETVTVKNESSDNDFIRVYLRAVLFEGDLGQNTQTVLVELFVNVLLGAHGAAHG